MKNLESYIVLIIICAFIMITNLYWDNMINWQINMLEKSKGISAIRIIFTTLLSMSGGMFAWLMKKTD